MSKKALFRFFLPAIVFSLLLGLLHWFLRWELIFLTGGVFLGFVLWETDNLFYLLFKSPYEYHSVRFKYFLSNRQIASAINFLAQTKAERPQTVFVSVPFQILLVFVMVFILTSSTSLAGKGIVLGLFLRTLILQVTSILRVGNITAWFWQFKKVPSVNVQVLYFVLLLLLFLFFSLFLV